MSSSYIGEVSWTEVLEILKNKLDNVFCTQVDMEVSRYQKTGQLCVDFYQHMRDSEDMEKIERDRHYLSVDVKEK